MDMRRGAVLHGNRAMIFVERPNTPPKSLISYPARVAAETAQQFFARPLESRLQERFTFDASIWLQCIQDLAYLFSRKCAYCETPLVQLSSTNIDHFRPTAEAMNFEGEADADGYWWLAYSWENLYLVCETCQRNKRNLFPVARARAKAGAEGRFLRDERNYLIDPCVDQIESYLEFGEDGMVRAPRFSPDRDVPGRQRGKVTIEILGLNRPELVAARQAEIKALREEWKLEQTGNVIVGPYELTESSLVDPSLPFAGMRLQLANAWIQSKTVQRRVASVALGGAKAEQLGSTPDAPKSPRPRKQSAGQGALASAGFIRSLSIENFRAIRNLRLSFPAGVGDRAAWKMLLGENGAGKSTVLQAIALALMGQKYLDSFIQKFRLRPAEFLRKYQGERRAKLARIEVHFSTGENVQVQITRKRVRFVSNPLSGTFVRGYGATRLLPRRNAPREHVSLGIERGVDNLFDPLRPVFNANAWLAGLKNRRHFGSAALALKDLLQLPKDTRIYVESGKVLLAVDGLIHGLDDLSAGYESVLVMAADIMAGVMGTVRDLRYATGIVLLDEIDAHLHPRWKMRIVESLRNAFSSMQFLVTTHEPLCLRGLGPNEVVVLERMGRDIVVLDDLPSPKTMRVDQLLTSRLFGLHSTLDPEIDEKLTRYYALLSKLPSSLSSEEIHDRDVLRSEVARYEPRLMAGSPSEELLYEAINEYLAKEATWHGSARRQLPELREETKNRVIELWKRAGAAQGTV